MFCYGTANPKLSREEARAAAAACTKLNKGRTVETVRVEGRERGMARRNAEELVLKKRAQWIGEKLVRILEGPAQ